MVILGAEGVQQHDKVRHNLYVRCYTLNISPHPSFNVEHTRVSHHVTGQHQCTRRYKFYGRMNSWTSAMQQTKALLAPTCFTRSCPDISETLATNNEHVEQHTVLVSTNQMLRPSTSDSRTLGPAPRHPSPLVLQNTQI